ncbi:unnamed protein product [Lymnaea stagnalis]|uniref:unspecific monooxygenase n=1 Tax=Lymnaea stagnalis TaxID=6523 RepID=A0AAV2IHR6_LYMST
MSEDEDEPTPSWHLGSLLPELLQAEFVPHVSILVLAVTLLLPLIISGWRWHSEKPNKKLPGPWSWPIFGHVKTLFKAPHTTLTKFHETYGDIYKVKVGQCTVVVVGSLDGIMEGLHDRTDTLSGRPDFQNFSFLYDSEEGRQRGVCTADNTEKNHVRRTFLLTSVDAYCSDVSHIEEKLSSEIIDTVNRLIDQSGAFDPLLLFKSACFNITFRLVFDQRLDPQGSRMKETLTTVENRREALHFNSVDFCPLLKIFKTDDYREYIQNRTLVQLAVQHKYLNIHKDSYDVNHIRDMADHLLLYVDNGEDFGLLGKEDLDYLLLDALTFGYYGTAVTLTWLLGYMADNPKIQRQIQEELDSVIGHDRLPGVEDQPFLPLTTAAIYESLRLATIYPFLLPHSAVQHTFLQGYPIAKGSIILFNIWRLHHDPKLWKNPYQYNPKRFINKEKVLEIPDHFIPYGAGRRQCPGEGLADVVLFLFFATIMQQLTISADQGFPLTAEYDCVIKPKSFTISVTERD